MILRRPYAFLIKHFRLIHLLLFVLFSYITYKANNVLTFFKEYITYNGNMEIVASDYISYSIFVSVMLIITISIIIFFLMKYKKKPKLFYIITVIVSFVATILIVYLYNNIRVLETSIMDAKNIRLLRDISRFNFYLLFITCIPILIRGLGFDIKKFNFTNDLHDLKLSEEDSGEVEVNVDLSSDGIKRTGRKTLRELKYYYLENKLIINIILSVVAFILIMMFPFNKFVINRDLNEGEILGTNYFNIKVNEAYISNRNRISKNNNYVILKIEVKGKINKYTLDLDEFVLEGKNNKYIPSLKYYNYFSDLGVGYKNTVLSTEEYKEYLLIYNIQSEDSESNFKLKYIGNDKKIKINPTILE